jgi:UDP-2,3-diacylglucosamine pyrophosphatase LpxH/glycosyltransferase involved in cell wall biosynthesis
MWMGNKYVRPAGKRTFAMRIEIVTDTFRPDVNGVAMTLGRLTDGLRERGHTVRVIHTGRQAADGDTLAAAIPVPGYSEIRVGLPKPFQLRSRWTRRRPDVVYVATESPLGKSAVRAAKALDIPVAAGFHTNFQKYAEKYRLRPLEPLANAYLRDFHRLADCTIAPSPDVCDRLEAEGFGTVRLLGRGVDCQLFDPARRCHQLRAEWGVRPGTPVVLSVGRIAAEKNLELALATFDRMRREVPDVRAVVVGDGPLRAGLEQAHPWIHFAGTRTGEELARHYASADVLLFPSEAETFGNVLLEGMASGLATVSYDYAAAAMHVRHGENGFKAARGDAASFTALALAALGLNPEDPLRLAARQTATRLDWEPVVADFERHLRELAGKRPGGAPKPPGKRPKLSCRTVFLSDLHLGTQDSKADEVVEFLKHLECDKLVLNGDIIDAWALKRGSKWSSRHSRVIRKILKLTERDRTEVVYLRGNHDDILERFMPLVFGRVRLVKEHIHRTAAGHSYLVVHGDGFDSVSTNHRWLAVAGAVGYDFLLCVNRIYNKYRAWRGKEYYSLSKRIKAKVKSAVCFVDRYEELLQQLARQRNCRGIICGHIHTPEDKLVGDIHYLNSGDWVESLTAIIEHHNGRLELVRYQEFLSLMRADKAAAAEVPRMEPPVPAVAAAMPLPAAGVA